MYSAFVLNIKSICVQRSHMHTTKNSMVEMEANKKNELRKRKP